jgi:hypothetical protein
MPIPNNIKIGTCWYEIKQPAKMQRTATRGCIAYGDEIEVAKQCNVTGKRYTDKQRAETFWHEVTHGILYDMGHPMYDDEAFVDAFSKRLNNAIHSAEF